MNADDMHKKRLESEGKKLCKRCEGTGNEFYAMYRACKDCGGSGEAPDFKAKWAGFASNN